MVIGKKDLLNITINESYIPTTDPLVRTFYNAEVGGPPYIYMLWAGEKSQPFEIDMLWQRDPCPEGLLESSPSFSQTLTNYYYRRGQEAMNREQLAFICTLYLYLKGKVNLWSLMEDYTPQNAQDPVEKLFTNTYGRLVFKYQLLELFRLARPTGLLFISAKLMDFVDFHDERPDPYFLDLMLPNGMTMGQTIEKYRLADKLFDPDWYAVDMVVQIFKWYGMW